MLRTATASFLIGNFAGNPPRAVVWRPACDQALPRQRFSPGSHRHVRRNWLFIGSQLAGERAAVVMSLLQSAKLNGHDPWAYLKDVLTRLPMQLNSRIEELLPHRWQPAG